MGVTRPDIMPQMTRMPVKIRSQAPGNGQNGLVGGLER